MSGFCPLWAGACWSVTCFCERVLSRGWTSLPSVPLKALSRSIQPSWNWRALASSRAGGPAGRRPALTWSLWGVWERRWFCASVMVDNQKHPSCLHAALAKEMPRGANLCGAVVPKPFSLTGEAGTAGPGSTGGRTALEITCPGLCRQPARHTKPYTPNLENFIFLPSLELEWTRP